MPYWARVSTAPGNTGNLLEFDIPPGNTWNLNLIVIGPPGKLQNVGGKAVIHAVLISWLDGTVMSVGRSSSSHAQLETVHALLVIVILLIKLNNIKTYWKFLKMSSGSLLEICLVGFVDTLWADFVILITQHIAIALRSSAVVVTTTSRVAMALTSKDRPNLGILHFSHLACPSCWYRLETRLSHYIETLASLL